MTVAPRKPGAGSLVLRPKRPPQTVLLTVSEAEAEGDEKRVQEVGKRGRRPAPPLPLVHSGSLPLIGRRPAGERTGGRK